MKIELLNLASLGLALTAVAVVAYERFYEPSEKDTKIRELQNKVSRLEYGLVANTNLDCYNERVLRHPDINLLDCVQLRNKIADQLRIVREGK